MRPLHVGHRIALTLILALLAVAPSLAKDGDISGSGEKSNPYLIMDEADWNKFAENVLNGKTYAGEFIKLGADISVSQQVGSHTEINLVNKIVSIDKPFSGTFDGNGRTIHADITESDGIGTALFGCINGAIIKNLTVTGEIHGGIHAAGLVGISMGVENRIENCVVATTVNGGTHIGGILGHGSTSGIAIDNCVFKGKIVGGETAKGVFFGWGDDGGTKTVSNCLFIQQEGQNTGNLDLVKKNSGSVTVTNCYKTADVGSYGTLVYLENSTDAITQEKVAADDTKFYVVLRKVSLPGRGTESAPYLISNDDSWDKFAEFVNGGATFAGKFIKLTADIGAEFPVTAKIGDYTQGKVFSGTFDGKDGAKFHTITVDITDKNHPGTAVFGFIDGATIKNLIVKGFIDGGVHAAGLVGESRGTGNRIENCIVSATVSGSTYVAGILGHGLDSDVSIDNCVFKGILEGGTKAKGVFFGWGDNGGSKSVTNCLYIQQDGQETKNLDLVKKYAGDVMVTSCYQTANVGTYGLLVYLTAPAGVLTEERIAVDNTKFYVRKMSLPGSGTESDPYTINNTDQWDEFAEFVNIGDSFAGKFIKLNQNISVTKKVGVVDSDGKLIAPFSGTFDGGGKTITVDINDDAHPGTALFCYIKGATIKNLNVEGTVVGGKHAAGLVGGSDGLGNRIENCVVSATITGNKYVAGILGHGNRSDIDIDNCVFKGELLGGATAKGVFFGWGDQGGIKTVSNCLYIQKEGQDVVNLDLVKMYAGNVAVTNCYQTANVGLYGTLVYLNASVNGILIEKIASDGTPFYMFTDIPKTSSGVYVVSDDLTVNERLFVYGDVTLILDEGKTLNAARGIEVSEGNALTIEGKGTLVAKGGGYQAGIGGGEGIFGGNITINGGIVTSKGGIYAAGIGGGYKGSAGTISITGGKLSAFGGKNASGIGPGYKGTGGTVSLGWTSEDDFIYASSYDNISSINFIENQYFYFTENDKVFGATAKNIGGKKLQPLINDLNNLSYADIGVQPYYIYTGDDIVIAYDVFDLDGKKLIKGTDYEESFDKNPVKDKGEYTLTISAKTNSGYTGSNSMKFTVTDGLPVTSSTTALVERYGISAYEVSEDVIVDERIVVSGNIRLILKEGKKFTAKQGVEVSEGNSLTIDGKGTLYAKGGSNQAGIGGGKGVSGGNITINGGTVSSAGGKYGAGLGGGDNGSGGTITINGGTVSVVGGMYGTSLGGGNGGSGGTITINGGTVSAKGGACGAGLGGGKEGSGGNITINGGTVSAKGGAYGAGLGGGYKGSGGSITINSGTVFSKGESGIDMWGGSGIGGGGKGSGGTITINGGFISSEGGKYGAGLGGGDRGSGGNITINGGSVTSTGGTYGSGIGGGIYGFGGEITFNGGTVTSTGGEEAAGIGGGEKGSAGTIFIRGGEVTAFAGKDASGIGSGNGASDGTITLGWTNDDDFIYADNYNNVESISFLIDENTNQEKQFYYVENGVKKIASLNDINGKTIYPYYGEMSLASATISGINPYYYYTGDDINIAYTVVDYNGKTLVKETDYTEQISPWPIKNKGEYTLTLTAKEGSDYFDSKTIHFAVDDDYGFLVTDKIFEMKNGVYRVASDVTVKSRITVNGNVVIILDEGKTLTAQKGINVSEGNALTIEGKGTLNANGGICAGIGGGNGGSGGNITINGGVVTSTGKSGAGIGGGNGGSGGNITINGGVVTSTGNTGAGIGGGEKGSAGTIFIRGGEVTAFAGKKASGIGSGKDGSGGTVKLGWTNEDDFIYADNYNNVESISFDFDENTNKEKQFYYIEDGTKKIASLNDISEKTIYPYYGEKSLKNATISGVKSYYHYTGNEISFAYSVVDYNGRTLDKGIDYTEQFSSWPIKNKGGYTLTVAAKEGSEYSDSKTVRFTIDDDGFLVTNKTLEMKNGVYRVANDVTVSKRLTVYGEVVLVLDEGKTLTASKGIDVSEGNALTIEGKGTLKANGGSGQAGIGGGSGGSGGNITINGGTVTSTGQEGAGIGGGYKGSGGTITINGGVVASTGKDGSGIGGGSGGSGGNITINGGTVASTGKDGSGIGGGSGGSGGNITINGGTVSSTGGNGAGIGSGYKGSGGTITINGGVVTATGKSGSGIGSGKNGSGGTVVLGWTNEDDFIYANNYKNVSSLTFADNKQFYYTENGVFKIASVDDIGNKTLYPFTSAKAKDLSFASLRGIQPYYLHTGDDIVLSYTVTDFDGNGLVEGSDYKASLDKSPIKDVGEYTLTIMAIDGSGYTGSKKISFLVYSDYIPVRASTITMDGGYGVPYKVDKDVAIDERIHIVGYVRLILGEGLTLNALKGMELSGTNKLTIEGKGTLNAVGNRYNSGIGADDVGTLVINGGVINATGGRLGAGIGGSINNVNGGSITINGGVVSAEGGDGAAGIGGGFNNLDGDYGVCGLITINSGKVTANAGEDASGIGPGYDAPESGSVTLGWTNEDDFIYASDYDNVASLRFAENKQFYYTENDVNNIASIDDIAGKELHPFFGEYNLENASISGIEPSYAYTGNAIIPAFEIVDYNGEDISENNYDWTIMRKGVKSQAINVGEYTMVFTGLGEYKGTKKVNFSIVPSVIDSFAAVQVLGDEFGKRAVIDGEFNGTDAVNINKDVWVNKAEFNRKFTPNSGFSTIMLPFDVYAMNLNGVKSIIEFAGIVKKDGKNAVGMKYVWCDEELGKKVEDEGYSNCNELSGKLKAYTPYMVEMDSVMLTVNGNVTLKSSKNDDPSVRVGDARKGDWVFRGALQKKAWTGNENIIKNGKIWAFAASARNGATIGKFVKFGSGTWVNPFRAYLVECPVNPNGSDCEDDSETQPKASLVSRYYFADVLSTVENSAENSLSAETSASAATNEPLVMRPSAVSETASLNDMDIVIVGGDEDSVSSGKERTTVIGTLDRRSGEIRMLPRTKQTYDLKGRKVGKGKKAKGAYYRK